MTKRICDVITSIDTNDVDFSEVININALEVLLGVDESKTRILKNGSYRVVCRSSVDGNNHSTKQETIDLHGVVQKKAKEQGVITRMDLANGIIGMNLKSNYKQFRLLLELIRVSRKAKSPVFSTIIGINKKGNLKFSADSLEVTIYNTEDKFRLEDARLEFRYKKLNEVNINKCIEDVKKNTMKMLNSALKLTANVEKYYIKELIKVYNEDKKDGYIMNFTDFIVKYNQEILTKNIFEGVFKGVGIKSSMNTWLKNHRRKRTLEFVTESNTKKLVGEIKKSIRNLK